MFKEFNPNPVNNLVEDCTVRALCKIFDKDWDTIFMSLTAYAFTMKDMQDSNVVWGRYLFDRGFNRYIIPNTCPDCYTIKDFCKDNPKGTFAVATGRHVVAVVDGDYYDSWDSGNEIPVYFWKKE